MIKTNYVAKKSRKQKGKPEIKRALPLKKENFDKDFWKTTNHGEQWWYTYHYLYSDREDYKLPLCADKTIERICEEYTQQNEITDIVQYMYYWYQRAKSGSKTEDILGVLITIELERRYQKTLNVER